MLSKSHKHHALANAASESQQQSPFFVHRHQRENEMRVSRNAFLQQLKPCSSSPSSSSPSCSASPSSPCAIALLQSAHDAHHDGDFDACVSLCRRALQVNSSTTSAATCSTSSTSSTCSSSSSSSSTSSAADATCTCAASLVLQAELAYTESVALFSSARYEEAFARLHSHHTRFANCLHAHQRRPRCTPLGASIIVPQQTVTEASSAQADAQSDSSVQNWTGRPLRKREEARKHGKTAASNHAIDFHAHRFTTYCYACTFDERQQRPASERCSEAEWALFEHYIHGIVLLLLVLSFLSPPGQNEPVSASANAELAPAPPANYHPFLLSLVCAWPDAIKQPMRWSFFVLDSYSRILERLRAPRQYPHDNILKHIVTRRSYVQPRLAPLILLGESHSLSIMWRFVHLPSVGFFQFQPAFVSGLKAFHFAPPSSTGSISYIQASLRHHVRRFIPTGSLVLIQAGEIDCRLIGGMHAAVRKGKYPDMHTAIRVTVNLYVQGIVKLVNEHQVLALVAPVRPPPLTNAKIKQSIKWDGKKRARGYYDKEEQHSPTSDESKEMKSIHQQTFVYASADQHELRTDNYELDEVDCDDETKASWSKEQEPRCYDKVNYTSAKQIKCIQSLYKHAIIIRDFNLALHREIVAVRQHAAAMGTALSIEWLEDVYEELCEPTHIRSPSDEVIFGEGDGAHYVLNSRFSLEGLHLNHLYASTLETSMKKLHQRQMHESGSSMFSKALAVHGHDIPFHLHKACPTHAKGDIDEDSLATLSSFFE